MTMPAVIEGQFRELVQAPTQVMTQAEQWRDVAGYEGTYIVSNQGRVARLMKGRQGTNGYIALILSLQWKWKAKNIHNLVMDAFVGPKPFPSAEVDHIDADKSNNQLSNLRYVTRSENIRARWNRNGKMKQGVMGK